jgi:hypothetical protein
LKIGEVVVAKRDVKMAIGDGPVSSLVCTIRFMPLGRPAAQPRLGCGVEKPFPAD